MAAPPSPPPDGGRRIRFDHVASACALLISVTVFILQLQADYVDRTRQVVDAGAQSEAAFIQACLGYEAFVVEQYRDGLTENQIYELVPVGVLSLRVGEYQGTQTCPTVTDIVAVLEATPPSPSQ